MGLVIGDLLSLPEQYRYELHEGRLVVLPRGTFWHQEVSARLVSMLWAAGFDAYADAGIGDDRDFRSPDVGVVAVRPPGFHELFVLPGSAFSLVAEILDEGAQCGETTDKMVWYARQGVPEYWILRRPPGSDSRHTALIDVYRLSGSGEGEFELLGSAG